MERIEGVMLVKCSECGKEISDKSKQCINCGCPIDIILDSIKKNVNGINQTTELSKEEKILNSRKNLYGKIKTEE